MITTKKCVDCGRGAEWLSDYGVPINGEAVCLCDLCHNIRRKRMAAVDDIQENNTILDEAKALTRGERNKDYGHPAEDFTRIAGMWSALFGFDFKAEDVAKAMICVKLSREQNKPKRDNRVDIAGYADTLQMTIDKLGE